MTLADATLWCLQTEQNICNVVSSQPAPADLQAAPSRAGPAPVPTLLQAFLCFLASALAVAGTWD